MNGGKTRSFQRLDGRAGGGFSSAGSNSHSGAAGVGGEYSETDLDRKGGVR